MRAERWITILLALTLLLSTAGCGRKKNKQEGVFRKEPLKVIATTTIVGDVVNEIGKDRIELKILLSPGEDPHSYSPTPEDMAAVVDADLIFVNGLGLEGFLGSLIRQSGTVADVVTVSMGIRPRRFIESDELADVLGERHDEESYFPGPEDTSAAGNDATIGNGGGNTLQGDPHVWLDPNNVMIWVANIQQELSKRDTGNTEFYAERADYYRGKLIDLDSRIMRRIAVVPTLRRRLVTDHLLFGYFADRYGFSQIGTILPGTSSVAEPSAQHMARLEETIRRMKVPAIFVGIGTDPTLANRIGHDLGITIVPVYTGSLSEDGGPAGSYIAYMEHNTDQIINALEPEGVMPR